MTKSEIDDLRNRLEADIHAAANEFNVSDDDHAVTKRNIEDLQKLCEQAARAEVAATETLLGALGDLTREAAKHIKPGDDGYAHLHFAEGLLAADDRRRGMNKEKR